MQVYIVGHFNDSPLSINLEFNDKLKYDVDIANLVFVKSVQAFRMLA